MKKKLFRVSLAVSRPVNAEIRLKAKDEREALKMALDIWDEREWDEKGGWIDDEWTGADDVLDLGDPDDPKDPYNPEGMSGAFVELAEKEE